MRVIPISSKLMPALECMHKKSKASYILSDDEKTDFVTSMEEYLLEMENDEKLFKVDITPMYKSTKLVEELMQQGYSASLYKFGMESKKIAPNAGHEAIWLGDEVPIDMAVDVLKTAKRYYPHLKYVHLNDASDGAPEYVKYQIYIGGSSDTARERGLRTLNSNDFSELYKLHTKDELHDFVKKFDPYFD